VRNVITPCANPFGMTYPPKWWLQEMWKFDDKLVIFPSQKNQTFILARRASRSAGEPLHDVKGVSQNPDTIFMNRHKLVRVCEIVAGTIWDMRVFARLAAHDIHRLGGHKKVSQLLEAMDEKRAQTLQRDQEAEVDARAHDAYKAMKFAIGERISMAPNKHGRGSVKKKPVSVHVRAPKPNPSGIQLATSW
jgi:hypothetical protein